MSKELEALEEEYNQKYVRSSSPVNPLDPLLFKLLDERTRVLLKIVGDLDGRSAIVGFGSTSAPTVGPATISAEKLQALTKALLEQVPPPPTIEQTPDTSVVKVVRSHFDAASTPVVNDPEVVKSANVDDKVVTETKPTKSDKKNK